MKTYTGLLLCILLSVALYGQSKAPLWLNDAWRQAKYPANSYYTGFYVAAMRAGEGVEAAMERATTAAKSELAEKIRVKIASQKSMTTQSVMGSDMSEQRSEAYAAATHTEAQVEVVGVKVQTYHDRAKREVYALAHANRYELMGYYKSNLSVNIGQVESFVKTAQDLESSGEKAKARQQCEAAKPLLKKIRYAQDLLTAIDINASLEDLRQAETESLYNRLTQMQARLAQGVYIFISGSENLFGKTENIIANRVKADLAHKGCSFVNSAEEADFWLKINADVRLSSQSGSLVFCFADVEVELFDRHKQKAVFGDEFSEKSGSSSQEKAGRSAMENAASRVAEKLSSWIQN